MFSTIMQRFVQASPMSVLARMSIENLFSHDSIDAIFDDVSRRQYTRELLFSTAADLLVQVTMFGQPSVNAVFQRRRQEIPVSVSALYQKLQGAEPAVCEALVSRPATLAAQLITQFGAGRPEPVPGYRLRIADGNVLGRSERRLKELRGSGVAALPGQTVALFDHATGLIREVITCEDGHTNERKLIPQLIDRLEPDDLLVADRNYAMLDFFRDLTVKNVRFLIRHHGSIKLDFQGEPIKVCSDTESTIAYQQVCLSDGQEYGAIVVQRKAKTSDGDLTIILLTNLKLTKRLAKTLAEVYRKRWQIEETFRQLTQYLSCEVKSLGYPKAALLAFSLAVVAYNCLACVKAALAERFGHTKLEDELSMYYLATEVQLSFHGMNVAIPGEEWTEYATLTPAALAAVMRQIVAGIDLSHYRKSPRGAKKPVSKKRERHVHQSTAKVIAARKTERNPIP